MYRCFGDPAARRAIEVVAMDAVMAAEKSRGNAPTDVSAKKIGYDIASLDTSTQHLRFIDVRGRVKNGLVREPRINQSAVQYNINRLLERAEEPP